MNCTEISVSLSLCQTLPCLTKSLLYSIPCEESRLFDVHLIVAEGRVENAKCDQESISGIVSPSMLYQLHSFLQSLKMRILTKHRRFFPLMNLTLAKSLQILHWFKYMKCYRNPLLTCWSTECIFMASDIEVEQLQHKTDHYWWPSSFILDWKISL